MTTSGNSNEVRPPTHHQWVVGLPCWPTRIIKHIIHGESVGVFCFTPGGRLDLEEFGGFVLRWNLVMVVLIKI